MDFRRADEQDMIAETARRLFSDGGDTTAPLQELRPFIHGISKKFWRYGCQRGGLDGIDTKTGRGASLEPLVFGSILPAVLLSRCEGGTTLARHVAAGETTAIVAVPSIYPAGSSHLTARLEGDG